MAKINDGNKVGAWSFLIGVILAMILGLFGAITTVIAWILVVVGFIVGLVNIADEEAEPFLLSGLVLIVAGAFGQNAVGVIPLFENVLNALLLIFVPAVIIV